MDETEYIPVGIAMKDMLVGVRKKHEELARDINALDKSYRRFVANDDDIEALRSGIERVRQDREEINKMSCEIVNSILNTMTLKRREIDKVMMEVMMNETKKAGKDEMKA